MIFLNSHCRICRSVIHHRITYNNYVSNHGFPLKLSQNYESTVYTQFSCIEISPTVGSFIDPRMKAKRTSVNLQIAESVTLNLISEGKLYAQSWSSYLDTLLIKITTYANKDQKPRLWRESLPFHLYLHKLEVNIDKLQVPALCKHLQGHCQFFFY